MTPAAGGRVLVTGAGGWIGRAVAARLRARGLAVGTAGRATPEGDLAAAAAAAAVVVHAGSGYSNARADFVDGGLGQAVVVARGCARADNAVVFLSSAKVYGWAADGGGGGGEGAGRTCDEDAACAGTDNFSAAKRLAEEILARAAARCTVLRISNVYGAGVPAKYAVGTMLASALRDRRVVLDCTGESRRDFVHLDDVVAAVEAATVAALAERHPGRRTFNVAAGRLVPLSAVAALVAGAAGAAVETRGRPPVSSPALANRRVIDAGYVGRFVDPLDGVARMMDEWKERPWQPT